MFTELCNHHRYLIPDHFHPSKKKPNPLVVTLVCLLPQRQRGRRKWQSTPVFLPGEIYGQKSLIGYSPWGCKESDLTGWLDTPLSPPLNLWQPLICFEGSCLFWIFCINGIIQHVTFYNWLLPLSIMSSRFTYITVYFPFSWLTNIPLEEYTPFCLSIHQLMNRLFPLFCTLNSIMNTLNIRWKDWCWSWGSSTLVTWCEQSAHWERPWCL